MCCRAAVNDAHEGVVAAPTRPCSPTASLRRGVERTQARVEAVFHRCLIACANYPEFWERFAEFQLATHGPAAAAEGLTTATTVFLPNRADLHLLRARLQELAGDAAGAKATFDALLAYVHDAWVD